MVITYLLMLRDKTELVVLRVIYALVLISGVHIAEKKMRIS
mgnify:CR=1 FL=1